MESIFTYVDCVNSELIQEHLGMYFFLLVVFLELGACLSWLYLVRGKNIQRNVTLMHWHDL